MNTVVTRLAKRSYRILPTALLLASTSAINAQAIASTFYVDPDSGSDANFCTTEATPCKTIQHVVSSLTASGDSIHLAPYPEPAIVLGSIPGKPKVPSPGPGSLGCLLSPVVFAESQIHIDHSLTLLGKSQLCTVVDGNALGRIFNITSGGEVTFKDMTIRNGDASSSDGGAILVQGGDLTLQRVTVENSVADRGGAIALLQTAGNATIKRSTLSENVAAENGGAVSCAGCASLAITNSALTDNDAGLWGGALLVQNSSLALSRSTLIENSSDLNGGAVWYDGTAVAIDNTEFAKNESREGNGGAIYGTGDITIEQSTFAKNHAGNSGGAISAKGAYTVNSMNSTYSGNTANRGAVFHLHFSAGSDPAVLVSNSTIIDNSATAPLAQIFYGNWSSLWIGNSIVELDSFGAGRPLCSFAANGGEHNLMADNTCDNAVTAIPDFLRAGSATGIDRKLASNGGFTRTHAVDSSSNVIDDGSALYCSDLGTLIPLDVDQHGETRDVDGDKDGVAACDIGAVEYQ